MNAQRLLYLMLGLTLAGAMMVALGSVMWADDMPGMAAPKVPGMAPAPAEKPDPMKEHMELMTQMKKLLEDAKKSALDAGAKDAAAKIDDAMRLMAKQHCAMHDQACKKMTDAGENPTEKCPMCGLMMGGQPKVINRNCPITGNPIDPYGVPDNLTTDYMGKKIGFCCAACPPAWEKLDAAAKAKKYEEMMKPKAADIKDKMMNDMKKEMEKKIPGM